VLARLRTEEGFGMIELVMAMLMLTIGILGILAAFTSGSVAIRRASRVATASALADAQMELYRALRYGSIALDSASVSSANGIPLYSSDSAWSSSQVTTSCPTLPPECKASQSLTGADGGTYRVDTYITYHTPTSGRQGKLVTIVVRELSVSPSSTRARVSSTFDLATG
jgi:type II secretory pathway pseudopilin PulG